MTGAFVYDLYANRNTLSADDAVIIAIGFVTAFVAALLVVRALLDFVSRHGFAPFAWWRIAVGVHRPCDHPLRLSVAVPPAEERCAGASLRRRCPARRTGRRRR